MLTAVTVEFASFPVCRPPFFAPPLLTTTATTTTITATSTMPTVAPDPPVAPGAKRADALLLETPGAGLFLLLLS